MIAGHVAGLVAEVEATSGRTASARTLEPAVLDLLDTGRRMSAAQLVAAQADLRRLAGTLAEWTADVDVLLSPTTAQPPPLLGHLHTRRPARELFAEIFRLSPFAAVFNVTGGPALSLPWGLDGEGLPIGVHLGAAPGDDALVLGLAAQLEAARPGETTPRYDPAHRRILASDAPQVG